MPTKIKKPSHKHVVPKDLVKKALAAAKELEKLPQPTEKQIVALYKQGLQEAERLNKLLKPEWFVGDKDKASKAVKPVRLQPVAKPRKPKKK